MVEYAKLCYMNYPTIVNKLKESNITYENTKIAYADMDNRFAKSRMSIGESSNLAQLAMTYYWTYPENKDLYDNFVILSVIAQVAIDSCKREYEVDPIVEIERIKKMECMNLTKTILNNEGKKKIVRCDLPKFMKYTKEIKTTKNGKEISYEEIKELRNKIENRINDELVCPMNWLQDILDEIQMADNSNTIPTVDFFIKMNGKAKNSQMTKIRKLVDEYDNMLKDLYVKYYENDENLYFDNLKYETNAFYDNLRRIKVGNIITINRLIEISLGIEKDNNNYKRSKECIKHSRKILNAIYKMNKEKFLVNFS